MSQQFLGEIEPIFTGAQGGYATRWSAANFFDKVIFANGSVSPQYWPGGGLARTLPGLPGGVGYDGVEAIGGYVVLWKDEVIKWSAVNDFSLFIPVGETAVSLRATTLNSFEHPAEGYISDWVHLDEDGAAFVEGQYVRVDINPDDPTAAYYHFYLVEEVASPVGIGAETIAVKQTVSADAEDEKIFTTTYSAWAEGSRLIIDGAPSQLEVVGASRDLAGSFTAAATSDAVPPIGGTFQIQVSENPSSLKVGDVLSVGQINIPGLDLYEVMRVGFFLELKRLGIGTEKAATNYRYPEDTYLTFQPFLKVKNLLSSAKQLKSGTELTAQLAVKLKGLGLTGEMDVGETISAGVDLASLDANDAGETVNAGSAINGPVFAVVSLGEYGVILKERSIQSMQMVGQTSGTFFIRPEVLNEGPIAKNAWCRADDKTVVFVGSKEIYSYSGGQVLVPIATQHSKEMYEELDRSRADEIVCYHNERQKEIWVCYPVLDESDGHKVLIFNYRFNTVVIDYYDASLNGITAVGGVDWEVAPTWRELSDTLDWIEDTKKWREYVEDGQQRYTVIAVGGEAGDPAMGEDSESAVPRLLLHGRKYSRASSDNCNSAAYLCLAETQDFDFGDAASFKYVDTLQLNMEVDEHLDRPMFMWVQLGSRANLDSDIKWSSASKLEVSGNGMVTTKVNIRAAGRFLRIRFYSQSIDAQWKIAGFKLIARPGGTY